MNIKTCILVIFTINLIDLSSSQVSKVTKCPDVKAKDKFEQKSIAGKWYEARRYPSNYLFGTCVTIDIKEGNQSISITTNQTFPGVATKPQSVTFGKWNMKKGEGIYNFKLAVGLGKKSH